MTGLVIQPKWYLYDHLSSNAQEQRQMGASKPRLGCCDWLPEHAGYMAELVY